MDDEYSDDCLPGDMDELELEVSGKADDMNVSIQDNVECDDACF